MKNLLRVAPLVAVALLALPSLAHAQQAGVLDQILAQFQTRSQAWEGVLRGFATHTFAILAMINLAFALFRLIWGNAGFDEWMGEIVNQIVTIGFFTLLLENSADWSRAIINSYRQVAYAAGGIGITPSDVFAIGVNLGVKIIKQGSIYHPVQALGLYLGGIGVELTFVLMTYEMISALVTSYFCISGGVINMAFGASVWTRDLAISTIRYAVSVGARMMMLQFILSVGVGFIRDWAAQDNADYTGTSFLILLGCSVILAALSRGVPREFQNLVGGASIAEGRSLTRATTAMAAGTAAVAAGVAGAGAAAVSAGRLAGEQLATSEAGGAPAKTGMARIATLTGMTTKNAGQALAQNVGQRLAGEYRANHGKIGWQMARDMGGTRRALSEDRQKPAPASATANTIGSP